MVTAMRVAGNKESKHGKGMATATRVTNKQTAMVTRRAITMATREKDEEEGDGKGDKRDDDGDKEGDGKEGGNGKQQ